MRCPEHRICSQADIALGSHGSQRGQNACPGRTRRTSPRLINTIINIDDEFALTTTCSFAGHYAEAAQASGRAVELDSESYPARVIHQEVLQFSGKLKQSVAAG
jgi:hypothetical protein